MKNIILLTIAFCLCDNLKSQNYTPFDFENGLWLYSSGGQGDEFWSSYEYQYFCNGDTLIDSVKYYKLYQYSILETGVISFPATSHFIFPTSFKCAIRNNDKKQVIAKFISDSIPKVIFDFNLKIGDTILNGTSQLSQKLIVKQIDSIKICSKYHKRFKSQYRNPFSNDSISLIEGIGMNQCLFGINILVPFESSENGCYTEKTNRICNNCKLILNIKTNLDNIGIVDLFPNPANTKLSISASKNIRQILIYNLFGQPIYMSNQINSENVDIDIKSFLTGSYFIKVEFSDKNFQIKQFIKE
jgi:hypothetical protein